MRSCRGGVSIASQQRARDQQSHPEIPASVREMRAGFVGTTIAAGAYLGGVGLGGLCFGSGVGSWASAGSAWFGGRVGGTLAEAGSTSILNVADALECALQQP